MPSYSPAFSGQLALVTDHIQARASSLADLPTLPTQAAIDSAFAALAPELPDDGWGTDRTVRHLLDDVVGGLAMGQAGPHYYGFVTGGVTEVALLADLLVTSYDANVQVHLPTQTLATSLEARTLALALDLLNLPREAFLGRTLTTGATAANVAGLACARDALFLRGTKTVPEGWVIAEDGYPPGGAQVEILGARVHASLVKAAAITGIGRRNVVDLGAGELAFDLARLRERLAHNRELGKASIVAVGFGEINTGGYTPQVPVLHELCDEFGAWLHIDAAFGAFAAALPELAHYVKDLELADSIVADGHKWLNVPYDCGLLFTRSAESLPRSFGPSPASAPPPYLTPGASVTTQPAVPSPLNVGIENSRRFRALPLYASLVALGRTGYRAIVRQNVAFADRVRDWMRGPEGSRFFVALNPASLSTTNTLPLNIVLFRGSAALDPSCAWHPDQEGAGQALTQAINDGRRIYCSPTVAWDGKGACRIAVSNWGAGAGGEAEWERVRRALVDVGEQGLRARE